MKPVVRLAGYNVDADLLADVIEIVRLLDSVNSADAGELAAKRSELVDAIMDRVRAGVTADAFTPETISAAYARISRDPSHVTELRRAARFGVARARKSNENIIFGLGHASVSEHAAFNFDVSGISRLASEEFQSHRLLSFTEKSQRYISIGSEYIIPDEARGTELEEVFATAIPRLFQVYGELTDELSSRYLRDAPADASKLQLRDLETHAKEDTRYLLPLACTTQMGVTMNARNVEHVVRELSDHPLSELRELGKAVFDAVGNLAPSLVKYTARGDYPRNNRAALSESLTGSRAKGFGEMAVYYGPEVRIVDSTPDGEVKILRAVRFTAGSRDERDYALDSTDLWTELFRSIRPHDSVLREFELASITFEAEISASCFAQLKRHRMMTLISQEYQIDDGIVLPPSLRDAGYEDRFCAAIRGALASARAMERAQPMIVPYFLTNAHRRRVMMQCNARELYHFARLRCDGHAQWEIRGLGEQMLGLAKALWPRVFMLACGKDKFAESYVQVFGDPASP